MQITITFVKQLIAAHGCIVLRTHGRFAHRFALDSPKGKKENNGGGNRYHPLRHLNLGVAVAPADCLEEKKEGLTSLPESG
jgi:hypothetical protein